ncbi:class I adenylate-forming enzyme family protein [Mycobacterium arosiense]|uniref:class I adenylate-forming enzyme family protein n=1 Tax=Mycobacterium arosiense TaxID=425468 RepID=UPI001301B3E3|nr:class I adenylate-forming enzyme family protein [Mycobacterium arosiense]
MVELVARAARHGDRDFLVQGARRVSFADFATMVWGTATRLIEDGLRPGECVAILAPNCIEWVLSAFATAAAGGVAVAFNTSWTPDDVGFALANSGVKFLVIHQDLLPLVPAEREVVTPERVYVIGSAESTRYSVTSFATLEHRAAERPLVHVKESDPFVVVYTSGTTGRAKGCITTHLGTVAQVNSMVLSAVLDKATAPRSSAEAGSTQTASEHALLATSPLFHVSGLHSGVCSALATKSKVVFLPGRFEPVEVLSLIESERITAWGGVPTMIYRVLTCERFAEFDISSLRSVAIGGAPLSPATLALAQRVLGHRLRIGHGYGMTEAHGSVTMNAGRALAERPDSVGTAHPLLDIKVVDPRGAEVGPGNCGEIVIRGVTVTPGYWADPQATSCAIRDGWLHTGDLGMFDEQGYLYLRDRLKDLIIRGGENIATLEIEHRLAEHPAVVEAAVFGIPDDDLGERIGAAVVLAQGADVSVAQLQAFVTDKLGRPRTPEKVWITSAPLPRNDLGKVPKARLRETLISNG